MKPKKYYYYKTPSLMILLDLMSINLKIENATLYIIQAGTGWEEIDIPKAQQSILFTMWRDARDNE